MMKIKDKDKNVKSNKGKMTSNIQGTSIMFSVDFSTETLQIRGEGQDI